MAGILSSILLTEHGLNWYYLSVVTGALGLVWAVGLRALTLHSLQNHKTRYKLSEGKRYTSLASNGRVSGGGGGGVGKKEKSNGGPLLGVGGISIGVGGAGGVAVSPARDSSRERLKLDINPASMMTSCSQLPLRNLVKRPPVL